MRALRQSLLSLVGIGLLAGAGTAHGGSGFDISQLPNLGDASSQIFSPREEARIGKDIVRQIRDAGLMLEDPDVEEYIQSVGQHLAAHSSRPGEHYRFFIMRSDGINAFALPGGYIGINAGLILAADTEAELAGVMAHEIAHVTQRHIARQMDAMRGSGLATVGAMIAAVLVASQTGNSDAAMAGALSAQALQMQRQINYTRAHEYEADRVGIRILTEAGFDPQGMVRFFEKLHRQTQHTAGAAMPEYLRTHPLTSSRITEARNRADEADGEHRDSSRRFYLIRERINAQMAARGQRELVRLNPARSPLELDFTHQLERYQQALVHQFRSRHEQAAHIFSQLANASPDIISYHLGWAENLVSQDKMEEAQEVYERAARLFPNNETLMESYARSLLDMNEIGAALKVLERLVERPGVQPRHHRLMARAHSEMGRQAESHYHMAGFHLEQGNIFAALTQMQLAFAQPQIDPRAERRFEQRMAQLRREWEMLPQEVRRAQDPRPRNPERD
ncbi:putative Zn-dependent protease [Natronospira proteinivora]|uniref:Zn-dependent protease n=1 Tax=Natronospira proteinivora TaxID=1807133 RepID=A0ABT1G5A0_9GAMM|nr:M48 family metalloprotease [Natronospira proteinivora]MCP1726479.1 putative Zn-dependent protease [Natronospira proteinivora]